MADSYATFELQITAQGDDIYIARVLQAPTLTDGHIPSHQFQLPYDDRTLQRIIWILSGERHPRGTTRTDTARQFGEELFQLVFSGEIHDIYLATREWMRQTDGKVRFRLNLKNADDMANLPWEFLRDPEIDYLALSRRTPIVRDARQYVNVTRLRTVRPLRILVMISAPDDLPKVDEEMERRNIERATIRLRERGLIEIDYLEDASLRDLQRMLRGEEYHVFHYIGHSAFDPRTGVGVLMMEDPYDYTKNFPVRGEALARELHEENTLRLVVLNSCQGAQTDVRDPFGGVASSLVQRGIPAVLAQQFEITDSAAIAFSEEFYRAVAEGFSLEAATAEGRRAIAGVAEGTIEWATPVLYLHESSSQHIFDFPNESEEPILQRLMRLPYAAQAGVAFVAMALFVVVLLISSALRGGDEVAAFAPPTATPIPDVDLLISDVRLSPINPQPGEFVAVFIDIENRGSDPSLPFTYEWQPSIADDSLILSQQAGSIAAGGILHDTLNFRYPWWGLFISETRLDTLNQIIETSEQNSRPSPVRVDSTKPLVIDFDEPLPNGDFIRTNQPVPFDAYLDWGFRIEAEPTRVECTDVVPWFKFVGISQIALTTGLVADPDQCDDQNIILIFETQRPDTNRTGVSAVGAEFAPKLGRHQIFVYSDGALEDELNVVAERGSLRRNLSLSADAGMGFDRIYGVRIAADRELNILNLTFDAP